jgi:Hypervirulence associated proteins TUDOR domain
VNDPSVLVDVRLDDGFGCHLWLDYTELSRGGDGTSKQVFLMVVIRVQARADDPQYEIKSDKTDHIALHKGSALKPVGR